MHHRGGGNDGGRSRSDSRESRGSGYRVEEYLHGMNNTQADLLVRTGKKHPLQEVSRRSGAKVQFDPNPSPVPGIKILIIRGGRDQIEAAVSLINETIGAEGSISKQAQTLWKLWVEEAFPDLDSRAYFLPPVYINRVPLTRQSVAGQDVSVFQPPPGEASQSSQPSTSSLVPSIQDSDVRDDAAFQRALLCLQKLAEQNKEVLFGVSHLDFVHYLGEPVYAAAAAQLPLPKTLPNATSKDRQGDFDVLLIHRNYGFVVCEVKSFGDNAKKLNMSRQNIVNNIGKRLKEAISQLDKAETILSHLVSDIAPGLRITKTIVVPNITAGQIQEVISADFQLAQNLCQCLRANSPDDIFGLCLCSDQLSDPKTPWDVNDNVERELKNWWQRRVAGAGPENRMTLDLYKILVARFCGPATTVSVPCTSPPRLSVKTLDQAVWCTGECYTALITLFLEQVHLLNMAPPRLFLTGPPGTGKTVVLLLMGIQWLRCGHDVYIVSTWWRSRAACIMLHQLLQKSVNMHQTARVTPGKPHLLQYHFEDEKDVKRAVVELSQKAIGGELRVIADEVVRGHMSAARLQTFCDNLLKQVSGLYLWAANCYNGHVPIGWREENLSRPLRSPPAVVREIEKSREIAAENTVSKYIERGVPDHTDGPPVRRLYHQGADHTSPWLGDCVTCGREVARFLQALRVGDAGNCAPSACTSSSSATPPCLQWREVLVLCWETASENSGVVTMLREAGIPVRVMKDEDTEDVATARSNVVWVADGRRVQGLERKVVVCLGSNDLSVPLHNMSRCTSQLLIITPENNNSSPNELS